MDQAERTLRNTSPTANRAKVLAVIEFAVMSGGVNGKGNRMTRESWPGSRPRRRAFLSMELLEGRALLNGGSRGSLAPSPNDREAVSILGAGGYVSQKASVLSLQVNRAPISPNTKLDDAVVVNVSAALAANAATSGAFFQPVNESVTLPPGAAFGNVSIPIQLGAHSPDSVPITISASTPTPGVAVTGAPQIVNLVSSPDALPPTITDQHLIVDGTHVTGIAITFSKPMNAASVENIHNYFFGVNSRRTFYDWFGLSKYKEFTAEKVALQRASYDPATNTVTLFPRKPLSAAETYTLSSPPHPAKHALVDRRGLTFAPNGYFVLTLSATKRKLPPELQLQPHLPMPPGVSL
jgi:hypothetical protein